jgi:hypothetical protein
MGSVLRITMSGNVDASCGKRLAALLNVTLEKAHEPVRSFWDLEALSNYHSDVRVLCTQALVRNWPKVVDVRTLATNRVVKMGVAVANVALRGRLHNTEKRELFEKLFQEATAK